MTAPCPFPASIELLVSISIALFLASALYAVALDYAEQNWHLVTDYTWLTVVVGVVLTLAGLAALDPRAAALALLLFTVTGIPMVARAIIIDARKRIALRDAIRGHDDE